MDIIDKTLAVSKLGQDRTSQKVFMKVVEEIGEIAMALNKPDKVDEPLVNEVADAIIALIDLVYINNFENDVDLPACKAAEDLVAAVEKKTKKWKDLYFGK